MRILLDEVKLYFIHNEITPDNVRFTAHTAIIPESGETVVGEFGSMGIEIRARVDTVQQLNLQAYEVHLTGMNEMPPPATRALANLRAADDADIANHGENERDLLYDSYDDDHGYGDDDSE